MSDHATLRDAILYFAEFGHCKDFMVQLRWPDGVVKCPVCGAQKVTWLEKPRVWKCYANHPKPRFSLKTGTIFEDSPIALEKWLPAVWMLLNCKNGISSYELHRGLGITQKSAWFMLQRIRLAMQDHMMGGMLGGEVEVDETFIGGKVRNMHKDKKVRVQKTSQKGDKAIVLGILERAAEGNAFEPLLFLIAKAIRCAVKWLELSSRERKFTPMSSDLRGAWRTATSTRWLTICLPT